MMRADQLPSPWLAPLSLVLALTACGGDSSGPQMPSPPEEGRVIEFEFGADSGWVAGFSDYPVGEAERFDLRSGFGPLPAPLEDRSGLNLAGTNHSDDLFMFARREFTGFEPNTQYELEFEITFATNVPSGCAGIGGAPGESVYIKAGAAPVEPKAEDDGTGFNRMNIDKGNQIMGGSDAITIGDFANSKECEEEDFSYELKTLSSEANAFSTFTDDGGVLWLLFGTDSGFEGDTSIYYVSGRVRANEL